jgi:hypothetical protein
MRGFLKKGIYGFMCLGLLIPFSYGGELMLGAGYGEQVGNNASQKNGVLDIFYNFYTKDFGNLEFSLGAGGSYVWTEGREDDHLLIATLLPSIRYHFNTKTAFHPFIFLGAGPSIMSDEDLGYQESGGRFTFNDFVGIGMRFGAEQQWTMQYCYRHISNAGVYTPNDGFDIPFCFMVGHRF